MAAVIAGATPPRDSGRLSLVRGRTGSLSAWAIDALLAAWAIDALLLMAGCLSSAVVCHPVVRIS
jgi:hypothetical protein